MRCGAAGSWRRLSPCPSLAAGTGPGAWKRREAGLILVAPPNRAEANQGMTMNHWAVLVAAVSSFVLGGLWYSPVLFGKAWNAANGGVPQSGHPAKVFGVAFVFS